MFGLKRDKNKKVLEPAALDDTGKVRWLANAGSHSIVPTAFRYDTELTLIGLLVRRIVELERRFDEIEGKEDHA